MAIQAVTVEHDEYLLLCVAVDATHGNVDIVIAIDDVHAWYIGSQYFLQIASATIDYHLFCNESRGDRNLSQRLCLTGGGGDGGSQASFDAVHHLDKGGRVAGTRTVVRILLKHQRGVLLSMLRIEAGQITESDETECVLTQIAVKVLKVL